VRVISANPRYTGVQVWNRQRKDEVLLDVNDVALGHVTKMRWNEPARWVWSEESAHPPLIDTATFERAQELRQGRSAHAQRVGRPTPRPYALRGLLFCGICQRRMQGSRNNQAIYYRCMFLAEYAARAKISHPRSVYLREETLTALLDECLMGPVRPDTVPRTIDVLARSRDDGVSAVLAEQARREIGDCDAKLRRHRAALEAGADPKIVTGWMTETLARRAEAETRLRPGTRRQTMTAEQIADQLARIDDIPAALGSADPAERAQLYGQLGLTMTYNRGASTVRVPSGHCPICT
jgi:site-specific DNA recombinase